MSNNSDSSLLSFLFGGFIGAVAGLLLAPRPGKETRAILSNVLDELHEKGLDSFEKTRSKATNMYQEGKEIIGEGKGCISSAIQAGKKIYKKEK
ncbi:YtxH domain-containing protein [bacterium]